VNEFEADSPECADGVELSAVREKYRDERNKRLRVSAEGEPPPSAQYVPAPTDDPYLSEPLTREPIEKAVDALVIGGGMGGLLTAVKLRNEGVDSVCIVEKAGDFGGAWYWNRYPGIQCDTESYIYMPLLEETGYIPTMKYAPGAEILAHCQRIGRFYDLYKDTLFQTGVSGLHWDEASSRWACVTDRGDRIMARFVVSPSVVLSRPKLPSIPGLNLYKGTIFHTSRWDYGYTGGDSRGGLVGLQGKRVGVVGTGATAVQCVPQVAEFASQLLVFQRTPSAIDERNNQPTDSAWASTLTPGWQRRRMENFTALTTGASQDEDLVDDGWTRRLRSAVRLAASVNEREEAQADSGDAGELADFFWMERIRMRVDDLVKNGATASALKAYYRVVCKRPCFSDNYLQSFNRANVALVDTEGVGIERLTESGVVVAGQEYPVDCLIFASGFETNTSWTQRAGYEVQGRGGLDLSDYWANGPRTFHGLHSHGFPNLFFVGATQTGLTANFHHTLREQTVHIAHIVARCLEAGVGRVEASAEAEEKWVDSIRRMSEEAKELLRECTPGYFNNEGKPDDPNAVVPGAYGEGPIAFFELLRMWREEGHMQGLTLSEEAVDAR
jgi:cyclohexanone monooxygenase